MASHSFALTPNGQDEVVTLSTPLVAGEPTVIWASDTVSQGTAYNSLSIYISYKALSPDTANVAPFDFEILATVDQEQNDGSWEELGRQNIGLRKLEQGAVRQIIITPSAQVEEGIDQVIPGINGSISKLKSIFRDDCSGNIRVCLHAVDNAPTGANPLAGVTFSVNGTRYDG